MGQQLGNSSFLVGPTQLADGEPALGVIVGQLRSVRERCGRIVATSGSKDELLAAMARLLAESVATAGIVYLRPDSALQWLNHSVDLPTGQFQRPLAELCTAACEHGVTQVKRLDTGRPQRMVVAVPVPVLDGRGEGDSRGEHGLQRPSSSAAAAEALAVLVPQTAHSLEPLLLICELVALSIGAWLAAHEYRRTEDEANAAAALIELLARVEACDNLQLACYTVVNELKAHLGCRQVALGLRRTRRGSQASPFSRDAESSERSAPLRNASASRLNSARGCRLVALSGAAEFDRNSEPVRFLEAAMDEAIVRGTLTFWPPRSESDRHALLAHKKLAAAAEIPNIISSPLRDEHGTIQGAWIFLGEAESRVDFSPREHQKSPAPHVDSNPRDVEQRTTDHGQLTTDLRANFIAASERRVGSCLALLKRAERGKLHRCCTAIADGLRTWKGSVAAVATLAVAGLLMLPTPYKVKCSCELQPVTRRFVAAPFEGTLEETFFEPGDLVREGDLLARMDGREIRWELAGVVAEYNRAAKQRDAHLAGHDFAAAQRSKFEMERLNLQTELLQHREEHVEIRSPLDGILISGDLKKAKGVRLTVGQTLFEVAPLGQMVVEIAVAEDDIAHAAAGSSVAFTLDAYPGSDWRGTIAKIHPRSEIRDNENVFIAEVRLENPDARLRPGMRGRAKIITSPRPLAWNLFHKPWEKLLLALGW